MAELKEKAISDAGHCVNSDPLLKRRSDGVALFPQPSDDPADPLNWSLTRKLMSLFIVALAGGIGTAQVLASNSGYFVQAKLYEKTAVELSYGVMLFDIGLCRISVTYM